MNNKLKNKKVMILGGGLQALSVARSLKEVGAEVTALIQKDFVYYSKYIDNKIIELYQIETEEKKYLNHILDVLKKYTQDVVIPMGDMHASFLSKYKNFIESKTKSLLAVTEHDIFSIAHDKEKFIKFCQKNNIPHPRTWHVSVENIEDIVSDSDFPAIIKPNISVGARGITIVNSIDSFKRYYPLVKESYGDCTLQEYIENSEYYYSVMLYRSKSGEFFNSVILKILRFYPIEGGSSSFGITVENPKIVEICQELLEKMSWVGFANLDILEKGKGDYRIIELNPRVPASLRAAFISGVNFPELIVSDLLGYSLSKYKYKAGKQLRYFGLDIMWFLKSSRRFQTKPSWLCFFGKNLYYQEGGIEDYKAMIFSLFSGIKKIISPTFMKSKKIRK